MSRLQQQYKEQIVPNLQERFSYKNVMMVPKIEKITLNMGLGEAIADKKIIQHAVNDMTLIAGQKPVVTLARKSVAGFKVREDWPIGCKGRASTASAATFVRLAVAAKNLRSTLGMDC